MSEERDDMFLWGGTCLPIILAAIDGHGDVPGVDSLTIHAEYGAFSTATLRRPGLDDELRVLDHFGTNWLSAVLGAPDGLQAITVDVGKEMFTIVNCRYVPIAASIDAVVAALEAQELSSA